MIRRGTWVTIGLWVVDCLLVMMIEYEHNIVRIFFQI